MDDPTSANDAPLYAGVLATTLILFACLASQLGPLVLVLAMAVGGFVLFGLVHYWLWGRRLLGGKDRDNPSSSD